ncbi:MAG: DUF2243 domain-containing protein [Gaiellaceae bacterium]
MSRSGPPERPAGTPRAGLAPLGAGARDLVNHKLPALRHVREGAGHETAYDIGFLVLGALLMIGGWLLTRSREADPATRS